MFDIGWFELFFVIVVAVIVVGPKDLPKMMRNIGRWTGRARAMADQFRRSFEDMARQSELEEMRTEMMKVHDETSLAAIKRETDEMLGTLPSNPLGASASTPMAAREASPTPSIENDAVAKSEAPPAQAAPSPAAPSPAPAGAAEKPAAPEAQSSLHRDEP
jgi:sec-independent protein translocase protein TatB